MLPLENQELLPKHLVIIPDGNGRWAQKHNLPIAEGHLKGAQTVRDLLYGMENLDIDVVTIWGFSTENWSRQDQEVDGIMAVMEELIQTEGENLAERGYKFRHVGRKDRMPQSLLQSINQLEERTSDNTGKTLVLALDYGGRDEIIRAVNKVGGQSVDENTFKDFLDTGGLPDPDLIIRTSGEMRTSGMYPYQGAYAEFISSSVLFPDFDQKELARCLAEYGKRSRRFGARLTGAGRATFDWLNLTTPSFGNYITALLPHLDAATASFLTKWKQDKFYDHSGLQQDIDIYQDLLSGGKKIRPMLTMLGFETFQGEGEFREGVLAAAIGYEVIHNAFLIHDDIMDNSDVRRGKPTVHRNFSIPVGINLGDLGPFKALGVLWDIDNRPDRIVGAQKWLRYVIETTLRGQRRDLTDVALDQLTEKYVYQVHHQKTAVYTIVGPLSLGAILAGASDRDLAHINTFGVNLGMAFQAVDDHLGMFGDEQTLGKSVDSDIKEAKKTLHFVRAFQQADGAERAFLQNVWGKKDITADELEQVRELIIRLGVRDAVLQKADELAIKAKKVIPKITNDPAIGTVLTELTNFVVARNF